MSPKKTVRCIQLEGSLEIEGAPELRLMLKEEIENGGNQLMIDLSRVTFIDSSCLGILVVAYKTTRKHDGIIKFVNPSPQVRQIFDLTRLSNHVEIYDSVEECEESFVC